MNSTKTTLTLALSPRRREQEIWRPSPWGEGLGMRAIHTQIQQRRFSLPMVDFGSGSHRCLGEHLAMLEATLMLAQLLRHFDWELVNGRSSLENLQQNLLIYPPDGMPLRFQLREAVPLG